MRLARLLLCGLLLTGCAAPQLFTISSGPRVTTVGPLTVWIVPEPEVDFLCGLRLHKGPGQVALGCYLPEKQTIISPPNVYVLLHELKHHFEGHFHK